MIGYESFRDVRSVRHVNREHFRSKGATIKEVLKAKDGIEVAEKMGLNSPWR